MSKQRINLYIDGDLWRQFRAACIQRRSNASRIAEMLIKEQMDDWDQAFLWVQRAEAEPNHSHTQNEVSHDDTND